MLAFGEMCKSVDNLVFVWLGELLTLFFETQSLALGVCCCFVSSLSGFLALEIRLWLYWGCLGCRVGVIVLKGIPLRFWVWFLYYNFFFFLNPNLNGRIGLTQTSPH